MVLIQVILIAIILLLGVNFLKSRDSVKTKASKKIFLLSLVVCAILAILMPNTLTVLAQWVGVSRGADLVLYGLAILMIFQLLNNYVKDIGSERRTVAIARKVAILEALMSQPERRANFRHVTKGKSGSNRNR